MPIRSAIFGTTGETAANARSGIVVRNPATVPEMDRSSMILEMTGPTEVSGDRRLKAMNTTPISSKTVAGFKSSFFVRYVGGFPFKQSASR